MRTALASALALGLLVLAPSQAHARQGQPAGPFGLGLEIGAPTGLAAKYYFSSQVALQMGLGVHEEWGDDGLHLHCEVVWHPVMLAQNASFSLPFYLGVGGRLLRHDHHWEDRYHVWHEDDIHLGVRVPFGILFDFRRVPLDVFIELPLVVDLIHDDYDHEHDVWFDLAIGARYYF